MRGYFGIGVQKFSKTGNAGNLFRTAHGFGASFVFTVDAFFDVQAARSDTSKFANHLPWYDWPRVEDMHLPKGCKLVGVELVEGAVELPSFRHPLQAAYVLGPERASISPDLLARCDHVVKIPTGFCLNVATAGAIIMYDRLLTLGRFPERPIFSEGAPEPLEPHVRGGMIRRSAKRQAD